MPLKLFAAQCGAEAVRQKLCSSILMMMSFHVEFLCLLLVLLGTAGAGKTIQNEDSTLPVWSVCVRFFLHYVIYMHHGEAVNFKFEFPVKDGEAGGQKAHDIEGAFVVCLALSSGFFRAPQMPLHLTSVALKAPGGSG